MGHVGSRTSESNTQADSNSRMRPLSSLFSKPDLILRRLRFPRPHHPTVPRTITFKHPSEGIQLLKLILISFHWTILLNLNLRSAARLKAQDRTKFNVIDSRRADRDLTTFNPQPPVSSASCFLRASPPRTPRVSRGSSYYENSDFPNKSFVPIRNEVI